MRREWVEVTRKNGFREGITDLLAHQYSEKTHFIFELLQNAEDAKASEVKFLVENERLVFSHNGELLFTDENVKSITSIGQSSKRTDYTTDRQTRNRFQVSIWLRAHATHSFRRQAL